jgi:hypothetical protein
MISLGWKVAVLGLSLRLLCLCYSQRFLLHQYLSESLFLPGLGLLALTAYLLWLCVREKPQRVCSRRITKEQYEQEGKEATEKALTSLWKSKEFRDMKRKMDKEGVHSAWEEPEEPTEDEEF